ncbi:hypothetical protein FSB78_05825 [Sphingomonas ginsenosidivorax]|uniref:Uncharacterized protein n=1 Tax=Sphingomonas ginsenosidivorax TaxID=862135 RepID=A0A5C6UE72_9SPHN|nr:hypothetical protein [Sphingomonas ginsenosidivorax]TXC70511.1 hypothetical protein FSB78_05825 [Sphingomonas ginsenosidivorax]
MSETPAERKEAAATRRRWVSLAEVLGVTGALIAALTLWINWSDRRADQADKAQARASEQRAESRVALSAEVQDGGKALLLKDSRHEIQDVAIAFPKALGISAQHPPADPLIAVSAFETVLLKLTDGGADERTGRLPVLLTISYLDGETTRTTSGIYDLLWKTEGRMLRGRDLRLTGMKVRQVRGTQAQLDAVWARAKP